MTDHLDVPIVATGDWIDAAWINQYIGDNVRAWRQAYTAAGMMAYALDANTLAGLAAPAQLSLVKHDGSVPGFVAKGTGYQYLRMNAAGDGFEFGSLPVTKLTGSGNQSVGVGAPILWTTESLDDGNWHSLVSNTSRVTVPENGRYWVSCILSFWTPSGGGTNNVLASIRVNGSIVIPNRVLVANDGQTYSMEFPVVVLALTAGQYIEVYCDVGGTLNMSGSFLVVERRP